MPLPVRSRQRNRRSSTARVGMDHLSRIGVKALAVGLVLAVLLAVCGCGGGDDSMSSALPSGLTGPTGPTGPAGPLTGQRLNQLLQQAPQPLPTVPQIRLACSTADTAKELYTSLALSSFVDEIAARYTHSEVAGRAGEILAHIGLVGVGECDPLKPALENLVEQVP